jgi:KipI family sensor histidine kinase inhibitor
VDIRRVGATGLMIEVDDPLAWFSALRQRRDAGEFAATEIIPGARTVLLDGVADPVTLAAAIPDWPAPSGLARRSRRVDVPVAFDGEDLSFVASHWDMTVNQAVARLAETVFTVAFCGFAPGFGYLTGGPATLHVPRHPEPRTSVPAGAVGLAGEFTGVYPRSSPGGWQLIGRTEVAVFDPDRDPPALLAPGARVRFTAVDR